MITRIRIRRKGERKGTFVPLEAGAVDGSELDIQPQYREL
jgi:hypothetical protein